MQATDIIILIASLIGTLCATIIIVWLILNQRKRVVLWLTYAVSEAEKQLGTKTGQYKLRLVYDQFVKTFPKLAIFISPDGFSKLVDIALNTMKKWIESGNKIALYIQNKEQAPAEKQISELHEEEKE